MGFLPFLITNHLVENGCPQVYRSIEIRCQQGSETASLRLRDMDRAKGHPSSILPG
jgi:hypothetical protein